MKRVSLISINIWFVAYLLNFVWEAFHRIWFYTPDLPVPAFLYITSTAAAGDGVWIVLFYWLVATVYGRDWLTDLNSGNLGLFVAFALVAAAGIERWALYFDMWDYGAAMPVILGVGLSPFIQLAVTGVIALGVARTVLYERVIPETY